MTMTERHFTKTVETIAKDDDEQVAISAVLVPDEVDRQLDFLRPDGVRNLFNPDADIGVMHSVFDNSAATSEHRILEEPETIGGEEYAAGTWVERREYHDGELWALVKDGVLEGRSIGGELEETREYAPGDVPGDVVFPVDVPSERGATEIVDGSVSEVSDVDVPAVPNAEHAVVKSDLAKDILDEVAGEDEFVQAMTQRGHSEEDAERLWAFMDSVGKSSTKDVDTTPPQDVQANAQAALDMREETDNPNDCGTQVGWARANQLANGESLTEDTIGRMVSFLSRHLAQAPDDLSTLAEDSCQRMMIQAWGGREGLRWAESVQDRLDADQEQIVNEPAESGAGSPDKDAMSNTDTDDEPTGEDTAKVDDVGEVDDATLGARIKSALGLGGTDGDADDAGNAAEDSDRDAEKVGRTLSAQNCDEAKAMHDHAERLLQRAGVDEPTGTARTYHEDTRDEFSLAQFSDDYEDKHAPAGETADEDTMTDEELNEKVDSLEAKVDELHEKLDDDAEDEAADDSEKADEQTDDNDELHEKLDDLTDTVDALDERIDKVAKGAADTDQIEGGAAGEESEKTSEAEAFKAALGGN